MWVMMENVTSRGRVMVGWSQGVNLIFKTAALAASCDCPPKIIVNETFGRVDALYVSRTLKLITPFNPH
jgi:hypothetical protein